MWECALRRHAYAACGCEQQFSPAGDFYESRIDPKEAATDAKNMRECALRRHAYAACGREQQFSPAGDFYESCVEPKETCSPIAYILCFSDGACVLGKGGAGTVGFCFT
ncbi:hypothetical protein LJC07_01300 [Christensenellaceae bacterium OttesenSCG-928-L17]|nr:hypothetical protein [Christensenellaceae bacterium OttesenSCG-928-L17]